MQALNKKKGELRMELKDLENRVYEDKKCIRFDYVIKGEQPTDNVLVTFNRVFMNGVENVKDTWHIRMILDKTQYTDTQVYDAEITIPMHDAPLVIVCGTGLHFIQSLLKEKIQNKSMLEFAIGEVVEV